MRDLIGTWFFGAFIGAWAAVLAITVFADSPSQVRCEERGGTWTAQASDDLTCTRTVTLPDSTVAYVPVEWR